MSVSTLLSRLDHARPTGADCWVACCPAHSDTNPSLAIRELDDGRVLVHCFAGCPVGDVLAAVGLTFSDLFPEKLIPHARRERMPFSYADALRCIDFEARLAAVAAGNIAYGITLTAADRARLHLAARRIDCALEVCNGR